MLQQRPNTFAQTILSLSFFACDKAADHTFRFADYPGVTWRRGAEISNRLSQSAPPANQSWSRFAPKKFRLIWSATRYPSLKPSLSECR